MSNGLAFRCQLDDVLHRDGQYAAQTDAAHDRRIEQRAHIASLALLDVVGRYNDAQRREPAVGEGKQRHVQQFEPV